MSAITWIVIVLIVISIIVTVTEVGLRFGILQKSKADGGSGSGDSSSSNRAAELRRGVVGGVESVEARLRRANITVEELRVWTAGLGEGARGAVCGGDIVGRTWAGV